MTTQIIERLRDENELLKARIRELEEVFSAPKPLPEEWSLTPTEAKIVVALAKRPTLSRENLLIILYGNLNKDRPGDNTISVFLWRIRKKLKPYGIEIKTKVWEKRYFMPKPSKEIVGQYIN